MNQTRAFWQALYLSSLGNIYSGLEQYEQSKLGSCQKRTPLLKTRKGWPRAIYTEWEPGQGSCLCPTMPATGRCVIGGGLRTGVGRMFSGLPNWHEIRQFLWTLKVFGLQRHLLSTRSQRSLRKQQLQHLPLSPIKWENWNSQPHIHGQ